MLIACAVLLSASTVGARPMRIAVTPPALLLPFPHGQTWYVNGPHSDDDATGARAYIDLGPGGGKDGTIVAAMGGTYHRRTCIETLNDGTKITHLYAEVNRGSWLTRYRHLKSYGHADNTPIAAGEPIGSTGGDITDRENNCGYGSFSHVHFGLLYKAPGAPAAVAFPLDGVQIGGYTVHATEGQQDNGWWTRGKTTVCTVTQQIATCKLKNDQKVADRTAPSAPTHLGDTAAQTSITLRWRAATDNVGVYQYELGRDGTAVGKTKTLSYIFRGLACGTTHALRVRAYDGAGNRSPWAQRSASTTACAPPDGQGAPSAPRLYWSSKTDILSSALSGSNAQKLVTLGSGAPESTYFVDDLAVGDGYVFWANDRGGVGRMSLAGKSAHLIIHSGSKPISLLFHNHRLYFVAAGGLYASGVSGASPQLLVDATAIRAASLRWLLAVTDARLIWQRGGAMSGTRAEIVATNLDGTNPQVLGSLPAAHRDVMDAAVAVAGNTVYWTRFYHHQIYRANLNGSNVKVLTTIGSYQPFRLTIGGGRVWWVAQSHPFYNTVIGSARLNGSDVRLVQNLTGQRGKPGAGALAVGS